MSKNEENVMDLLDSLDVKQGQKQKPKKSGAKRKENSKKAAGDDILQFLDELDPQKESADAKNQASANSKEAKAEEVKRTNNDAGNGTEPAKEETNSKQGNEPNSTSEDNIPSVVDPVASLSSWWTRNKGGLWSKAQETIHDAVSDAVKQARQAEAIVRDEQTHFNFNTIQNRLTSVLNTIVPPIGRHEQLRIHIFHDMVGYPSVDKLLYEVFDYVMDQVEGGGDLNMVVQKGKERHRVGSDFDVHRTLNYVRCSLPDGVKLARANIEEIRKNKDSDANTEGNTEQDNPNIRISEVFIAIQPVIAPRDILDATDTSEESLYFAIHLADMDHKIELSTVSQALPFEWAQWLDSDGRGFQETAIDPRDWVFGWVEDALNLAFGVVAQKYVTTRMGLTKLKPENTESKDA